MVQVIVVGVLGLVVVLFVLDGHLFFLFLLGLKVFLIRVVIGDFLSSLTFLNSRRDCLGLVDVGSSDNFWLLRDCWLVVEAVGFVSRFVSPDLDLSSLLIGGPLRGVFTVHGWRVLDVLIRLPNNGALSDRIVLSLVLSGLFDLSLVGINIRRLVGLVVGIVLAVVILDIVILRVLLLLSLWLIVNLLSVLVVSYDCFVRSLLGVVGFEVILVSAVLWDNTGLLLSFNAGLNSVQIEEPFPEL